MSNDRICFRTIYVLITPGQVVVYNIDPNIDRRLIPPYVLITIKIGDRGNWIRVKCVYVYGRRRDQRIHCDIPRLNLLRILVGTDSNKSVIDRLKEHFIGLTSEAISRIISPRAPELNGLFISDISTTNICDNSSSNNSSSNNSSSTSNNSSSNSVVDPIDSIDEDDFDLTSLQSIARSLLTTNCDQNDNPDIQLNYPGDTEFEQYINSFMAAIGAHLFVFGVLRMDQRRINRPFFPIEARPPDVQDCPEEHLTRSVGEYITYYARMLRAIARGRRLIRRVGPSWLSLVAILWRYSGDLFQEGDLRHPGIAAFDSILGFAIYQERKITGIICAFREFKERADQYLTTSRKEFKSHLSNMDATGNRNVNLINDKGEEFLQSIEKSATRYLTEISDVKTKALNDIGNQLESAIEAIIALEHNCEDKIRVAGNQSDNQMKTQSNSIQDELSSTQSRIENLINVGRSQIQDLLVHCKCDVDGVANKHIDHLKHFRKQVQHELTMTSEKFNSSSAQVFNTNKDQFTQLLDGSREKLTNIVDTGNKKLINRRNEIERQFATMFNEGIDHSVGLRAELERNLMEVGRENTQHISQTAKNGISDVSRLFKDIKQEIDDGQANVQILISQAQSRIEEVTRLAVEELRSRISTDLNDELVERASRALESSQQSVLQQSLTGLRDSMIPVARRVVDENVAKQRKEIARAQQLANQVQRTEANVRNIASTIQESLSTTHQRALQVESAADMVADISKNKLATVLSRLEDMERTNKYLMGRQQAMERENNKLRASYQSLHHQLLAKQNQIQSQISELAENTIHMVRPTEQYISANGISKPSTINRTIIPDKLNDTGHGMNYGLGPGGIAIPQKLNSVIGIDCTSRIDHKHNLGTTPPPIYSPVQHGVGYISYYNDNEQAGKTLNQILEHPYLQPTECCDNRIPTPLHSLLKTPTLSRRIAEKIGKTTICKPYCPDDIIKTKPKVTLASTAINLHRIGQILKDTRPILEPPSLITESRISNISESDSSNDYDSSYYSMRDSSSTYDSSPISDVEYCDPDIYYVASDTDDTTRPVTPEITPYPLYDQYSSSDSNTDVSNINGSNTPSIIRIPTKHSNNTYPLY